MPELDIQKREKALRTTVEKVLPDFAKSCFEQAGTGEPLVIEQDAFAADYDERKFELFGMAIKFAGLCGVEVYILANSEVPKTTIL